MKPESKFFVFKVKKKKLNVEKCFVVIIDTIFDPKFCPFPYISDRF